LNSKKIGSEFQSKNYELKYNDYWALIIRLKKELSTNTSGMTRKNPSYTKGPKIHACERENPCDE
jgi:hypothetical protein